MAQHVWSNADDMKDHSLRMRPSFLAARTRIVEDGSTEVALMGCRRYSHGGCSQVTRLPKRAHWPIVCLVHKAFIHRAGPDYRDIIKLTVQEIAVHADGDVVVKTWQASRKLLRSRIACARSILESSKKDCPTYDRLARHVVRMD